MFSHKTHTIFTQEPHIFLIIFWLENMTHGWNLCESGVKTFINRPQSACKGIFFILNNFCIGKGLLLSLSPLRRFGLYMSWWACSARQKVRCNPKFLSSHQMKSWGQSLQWRNLFLWRYSRVEFPLIFCCVFKTEVKINLPGGTQAKKKNWEGLQPLLTQSPNVNV